jgi:GntR family transcriptional regulator
MKQERKPRYAQIGEDLRHRIASGELGPGDLLPSEAQLSSAYEASRVTIRRALDALRTEGLVDARQGFGWFVATPPLRQSLARLGTIEEQLAASGRSPERRVLSFAYRLPPTAVAELLEGDEVLEVRRLNLADHQPFALVTVWCPRELADELSRAAVERQSFIDLLPVEVGGAHQAISATVASEPDAAVLEVPVGSPMLRAWRVTHDRGGRAVLVAEHLFPSHLTEFVVDLPHEDRSMAATGMRLVV